MPSHGQLREENTYGNPHLLMECEASYSYTFKSRSCCECIGVVPPHEWPQLGLPATHA